MMMEKATGYAPGEDFYKSVVASLQEMEESKLNETFLKIADIVTRSVDEAAAEIVELRKIAASEEEFSERSKEIEEVSKILNFN